MDDDYKEDDQPTEALTGLSKVLDSAYRNIFRQAMRGALFGLGHYLTYRFIGGFILKKFPQLEA